MRDGKERNALELDPLDARVGVEDHVEEEVATLVGKESDHHATHEATDCSSPIHTRWWLLLLS